MHEYPSLLGSIFERRRYPEKYSAIKSRLILKIYYIKKFKRKKDSF